MMIIGLFALSILLNLSGMVLAKRFQLSLTQDMVHFALYNLANALIASVYFFFSTGCHPMFNVKTALFAAGFAMLVCLTLVLGIVQMSKVPVALVSITNTAGSIIMSAVFGVLLFSEPITPTLAAAIVLMLAALVFPYAVTAKASAGPAAIAVCACCFLISGCVNAYSKQYAESDGVLPVTQFFLLTNLILVVISTVALAVCVIRKKMPFSALVRILSPKQYGNIAARTACSNVVSVLTVVLLARMNVSVYTVLYSAMTLVGGTLLSKFLFRERVTREYAVSSVLAVAALIAAAL